MSDLKHQSYRELLRRKIECRKTIGMHQGKINNQETRLVWIDKYLADKKCEDACCSACNHEWTTKPGVKADEGPCPECGDVCAQEPEKPLVHVGAELLHGSYNVEVMLISGPQVCVRFDTGDISVVGKSDLTPRKSPEQVELEAFLRGVNVDREAGTCVSFTEYAEALLKAGYRKEVSYE